MRKSPNLETVTGEEMKSNLMRAIVFKEGWGGRGGGGERE